MVIGFGGTGLTLGVWGFGAGNFHDSCRFGSVHVQYKIPCNADLTDQGYIVTSEDMLTIAAVIH